MTNKTKTTTRTTEPSVSNDATLQLFGYAADPEAMKQSRRDLVTAILVISVTINVVLLITWMILQFTTVYDDAISRIIFRS